MKSRIGNSLYFFATIVLLTILGAVTVCAQTQEPATQPKHKTTSDAATPSNFLLPVLGKGTTNFIPLWTGNYTIGNSLLSQTGNGLNVAGAVTAVSFTGNGAALTNVNASTLGGQSSSNFAQTGATNTFTADQTINGNLNLTGYVNSTLNLQGNLTDANGQEGANVLGGFAGNAAFPGNSIAPGVIGATIGGGGGVYDPSLLPQHAVPKRPQRRSQAPGRQALRNPFAQRSQLRADASEPAEQTEAAEQAAPPMTGLTSGSNVVVVNSNWSTIAGGLKNNASGFAPTVGGGFGNIASASYSTVAGGDGNTASDVESTVGGGTGNTASGAGDGQGSATVAGGNANTASGDWATVGGGTQNTASGDGSTVGGGADNTAGYGATVGGGTNNAASGSWATVPGGFTNQALGDFSFAAGCGATANYSGSFVWGGAFQEENCSFYGTSDTAAGQFVAEAYGGFYFYTSFSGGSGSGAVLASGSGSWSSLSDRNAKTNFSTVDAPSLLGKLAAMPVSTWNYKTQADSIRHLGPTAQDFHDAFGLGEDDKHISTVDAEGVALAGIQALYKLSQEKDTKIAELSQALSEKTRQLEDLERRLSRLEQLTDTAHSVAVVWPNK
jgi:hypothetical protein